MYNKINNNAKKEVPVVHGISAPPTPNEGNFIFYFFLRTSPSSSLS
jgi:hypothetical protein